MFLSEPRFIPRGDYQDCLRLRGRANQIMAVLEQRMRLGNLKQLSMVVDLPNVGTIKCSNIFGQRIIEVWLPGINEEQVTETKICICNCNFTTGWIVSVQEETIDGAPLYTVMACQGGTRYTLVENVLASDWTVYEVMSPVVLVPYYNMSFLCCLGNREAPTGCNKLDYADGGIESDDWRASLRIVPWCGVGLPKWRVVRG